MPRVQAYRFKESKFHVGDRVYVNDANMWPDGPYLISSFSYRNSARFYILVTEDGTPASIGGSWGIEESSLRSEHGHVNLGEIRSICQSADNLPDLNQAIKSLSAAMESQPVESVTRLHIANYIAILYGRRFEEGGKLKDLEYPIEFLQQQLNSAPESWRGARLSAMNTLGSLYGKRYEHTGSSKYLDAAIQSLEDTLLMEKELSHRSAATLSNLGGWLGERFGMTGAMMDLEAALGVTRSALQCTPLEDHNRPSRLVNLGVVLRRKFESTRATEDLDGAVEALELAVQDIPHDSTERVITLINLGDFLLDRYDHTGARHNIHSSIRATAEAVKLTPQDHSDYPRRLEALRRLERLIRDDYDDETMATKSVADDVFSQPNEPQSSTSQTDPDTDPREPMSHHEKMSNTGTWLETQVDDEEFDLGSNTMPTSGRNEGPYRPPAARDTAGSTTPPERFGTRESRPKSCSPAPSSSMGSSACVSEEFETFTSTENPVHPQRSGDEESDLELMRFSQPEKWLSGLKSLKRDVTHDSSLNHSLHPASEMFKIHTTRFPGDLILSTSLENDFDTSKEKNQLDKLMQSIYRNLTRMQDAKYCTDSINFLLQDPDRPCVARLVPVQVDKIRSFFGNILGILWVDHAELETPCLDFLRSLDSSFGDKIRSGVMMRGSQAPALNLQEHIGIILARITIQLLDIAIASFSGVHIESLLVEQDQGSETSRITIAPGLQLRQRGLRCLAKYLERPVWVVEINPNTEIIPTSEPLYLSTTIEDFASIWGPVWPVCDQISKEVIWYNVGLGSIVRWQRVDNEPEPAEDEVSCHWERLRQVRKEDCTIPQDRRRLLIGGMSDNPTCAMDYRHFTHEMELSGSLKQLGTQSRSYYVDNHSITGAIGGGALGPAIGGGQTYKMQQKLYREDLVSSMTNDDKIGACIAALRHLFTVEMSACTRMARRKSLLYALGCDEMKQYMNRPGEFQWEKDEWSKSYFEILRDEDGIQKLKDAIGPKDQEKDRRNVFRQALKASMLDILLLTGPREPHHFDAFWMSPDDDTAWTVRFPLQTHGWGRLLDDSVQAFSAVILSKKCLELKLKSETHKCTTATGNQCSDSFLETRLDVHPKLSPEGLVQRNAHDGLHRWSVRNGGGMRGVTFDLGSLGSLKVKDCWQRRDHLGPCFEMKCQDRQPQPFKRLLEFGRQAAAHRMDTPSHLEYIFPMQGERIHPILIYVCSTSPYSWMRN